MQCVASQRIVVVQPVIWSYNAHCTCTSGRCMQHPWEKMRQRGNHCTITVLLTHASGQGCPPSAQQMKSRMRHDGQGLSTVVAVVPSQ